MPDFPAQVAIKDGLVSVSWLLGAHSIVCRNAGNRIKLRCKWEQQENVLQTRNVQCMQGNGKNPWKIPAQGEEAGETRFSFSRMACLSSWASVSKACLTSFPQLYMYLYWLHVIHSYHHTLTQETVLFLFPHILRLVTGCVYFYVRHYDAIFSLPLSATHFPAHPLFSPFAPFWLLMK